MKKLIGFIIVLPVLLMLPLGGCSLDDPADPRDQVNPPGVDDAGARYVAIGNSLTAGFMDGALMKAGQANSYPMLISQMLAMEEFDQPWIEAPGIGSPSAAAPTVIPGVLYFTGTGLGVLGTTPATEVQSLLLAISVPTPYHNLGVPGATLTDGRNAYSSTSSTPLGNSFFDFINRSTFFGNFQISQPIDPGPPPVVVTMESGSMLYKTIAKGAALATVWLGNNDVLGPATSGSPPPGFGNPGSPGALAFEAEYTTMMTLLAGGLFNRNGFPATIVTANIPDITSVPYFVPEVAFTAAYPWPDGYEEADVQYVRFPTIAALGGTDIPAGTPIPANYTLSGAEAADVATAVATYNFIINSVSAGIDASGIAKVGMMDANAELAGLTQAQRTHFLSLVQGGMDPETAAETTYFSLDGIHPNNVGYGFVANLFIDEINELDGSAIPHVDLGQLEWDPTYGVPLGGGKAAGPYLSPEAAEQMGAIFR